MLVLKKRSIKNGTRIAWLDTLKSLSLFSVVLVHTGRIPAALKLYFNSFYMPVFFFISGLLVKESIREERFFDYLKIRSQRLLVPYLTFNIFSYALWIILLSKIRGVELPNQPILHFLANVLYGVGGYGWLNYNITLWFFPCLFITEVIFYFLIRMSSKQNLGFCLLALSIVGYFYFNVVEAENFRLPFGADIALTATVFYGAGYLLRPYILDNAFTKWCRPSFTALGALIYVVSSNLNESSAFVIGNFGKNYLFFYLAAFSGIFFWIQISRLIKPNLLFDQIGKNTLVIFPLHLLLFPFFTGILVYAFKVPKATLDSWAFLGIFYAIAAILILILVAWGLNKYAPFLLGKSLKEKAIGGTLST